MSDSLYKRTRSTNVNFYECRLKFTRGDVKEEFLSDKRNPKNLRTNTTTCPKKICTGKLKAPKKKPRKQDMKVTRIDEETRKLVASIESYSTLKERKERSGAAIEFFGGYKITNTTVGNPNEEKEKEEQSDDDDDCLLPNSHITWWQRPK